MRKKVLFGLILVIFFPFGSICHAASFSEDFNDGNFSSNPVWTEINKDDCPGTVEVVDGALHFYRDCPYGNGGNIKIETDTEIEVTDTTTLTFDGKPISRNVDDGCGWTCGEFPISLLLYLEDGQGNDFRMIYALNYGDAIKNRDEGTFKQVCRSVSRNEWTTVSFVIRDEAEGWPQAAKIKKIAIRANGWDFESYVDNVEISGTDPEPLKDINIDIRGENGEKLNGKLYIKLPPPWIFKTSNLKTDFYPYFSNLEQATIVGGVTGIDDYVLGSFDVINGRLAFDTTEVSDFSLSDNWYTTPSLNPNETRYIFFYPTDAGYENTVTWWTLYYRKEDKNNVIPYIQYVRVLPQNDWTEELKKPCDGEKCYSPNHRDVRNYVLEAPYKSDSAKQYKVYDGEDNPTLLVHGINGQAGYWKENVSVLRKSAPTENTWVFNYRGTENIWECSKLLRSAIEDLNSASFYKDKKISVATHSYGGVVTRRYCTDNPEEAISRIAKIIMFGPPHHGSYSAKRVYEGDSFAFKQRLWKHLDPYSPIYYELTPGSPSLMIMAGKPFPSGMQVVVVAGTKTYLWAGVGHDEAPDHDDGVVSISSASLLPLNTEGPRVPLWLMYINHDEMRYDSRVAEVIGRFVDGSDPPTGKDELIVMRIEDEFPRETGNTYHEAYPRSGQTLYRVGLIVDCRDCGYSGITKVETDLDWNWKTTYLEKHPDYDVFFFYENIVGTGVNWDSGLAYPLKLKEEAFSQDVKLTFFSDDTPVAERVVQIYPCATTVFQLMKGQSPYSSLSDSPILKNITFTSESNCEFTAKKSISVDSGTKIENGARVTFKAPRVNLKNGVMIEKGCLLIIKQ